MRKTDETDRIEAILDSAVLELNESRKQLDNCNDSTKILRDIMAAVVAQELTRMTISKNKMVAEDLDSIDPQRILSDWRVLARHYDGSLQATLLSGGIAQLERLSSEQIQPIIHEMRITIEPTINWAMEEKS